MTQRSHNGKPQSTRKKTIAAVTIVSTAAILASLIWAFAAGKEDSQPYANGGHGTEVQDTLPAGAEPSGSGNGKASAGESTGTSSANAKPATFANPSYQAAAYSIAEEAQSGGDPILDGPNLPELPDAAIIEVSNAEQLNAALAKAAPGQVIELADGVYESGKYFHIKQVKATAEKPLIVRAKNQGKAVISGNSWFLVDDSSYVVIEGLTFQTEGRAGNMGVRLRNTHHSRITRNHFALNESPQSEDNIKWVFIGGKGAEFNRVDHNHFEKKRQLGNFVTIDGDGKEASKYNRIDHNHFKDAQSLGKNGMEAIRIGTSGISMTDAFAIIEFNLFEQCSGDAEIISVKTGGNQIRYNTFLESEGSLTFRHGNGNSAYGNFFLGNGKRNTGGIRIYGEDHQVYNNYFEGLAGTGSRAALVIGAANVDNEGELHLYWRVKRLLVAFNTFVNNQSVFEIAADMSLPFAPLETVIANNLVVGDKGRFVTERAGLDGVRWQGNLMFAAGSAWLGISEPREGIRSDDPRMAHNGHFWQITAGSPAVDAAEGTFETIKDDIAGFARGAKADIGATELADPPGKRIPLDPSRVGPLS